MPEDVAVIGFDDLDEARYSLPSLTTVDPGRAEIAETAVRVAAGAHRRAGRRRRRRARRSWRVRDRRARVDAAVSSRRSHTIRMTDA